MEIRMLLREDEDVRKRRVVDGSDVYDIGDEVRITTKAENVYTGTITSIGADYIDLYTKNGKQRINIDVVERIDYVHIPDNEVKPQVKRMSGRYPWGSQADMVSHPPHYQSETGLEVIDVIEAFTFDLKGIEGFDTGNVIKYICRWKQKNGVEDLKKAKWYLEHLINHVELLEKENG